MLKHVANDFLFKAWASVESGVQRAMASYCMTRFQKASKARWIPQHALKIPSLAIQLGSIFDPETSSVPRAGREGMKKVKDVIRAKLEAGKNYLNNCL